MWKNLVWQLKGWVFVCIYSTCMFGIAHFEYDWIKFICLNWGSPPSVICMISSFLPLTWNQRVNYMYFAMLQDPYFVLLSCLKLSEILIDAMYLHSYTYTEFVTSEIQGNEERGKRIHIFCQSTMFWFSGHVDNMSLYRVLFIWTKSFQPFKSYIERCKCCVSFASRCKFGMKMWDNDQVKKHFWINAKYRTFFKVL